MKHTSTNEGNIFSFIFILFVYKYIIVNSYGARWVKRIKDNVTCLNKE